MAQELTASSEINYQNLDKIHQRLDKQGLGLKHTPIKMKSSS
jgi:hypothetical protein